MNANDRYSMYYGTHGNTVDQNWAHGWHKPVGFHPKLHWHLDMTTMCITAYFDNDGPFVEDHLLKVSDRYEWLDGVYATLPKTSQS